MDSSSLPGLSSVPSRTRDELLSAYDEWLYHERRMLHIERYGKERYRQTLLVVPCTPAAEFHFPMWPAKWEDRPQPSTRAALVLQMVGCDWRPTG